MQVRSDGEAVARGKDTLQAATPVTPLRYSTLGSPILQLNSAADNSEPRRHFEHRILGKSLNGHTSPAMSPRTTPLGSSKGPTMASTAPRPSFIPVAQSMRTSVPESSQRAALKQLARGSIGSNAQHQHRPLKGRASFAGHFKSTHRQSLAHDSKAASPDTTHFTKGQWENSLRQFGPLPPSKPAPWPGHNSPIPNTKTVGKEQHFPEDSPARQEIREQHQDTMPTISASSGKVQLLAEESPIRPERQEKRQQATPTIWDSVNAPVSHLASARDATPANSKHHFRKDTSVQHEPTVRHLEPEDETETDSEAESEDASEDGLQDESESELENESVGDKDANDADEDALTKALRVMNIAETILGRSTRTKACAFPSIRYLKREKLAEIFRQTGKFVEIYADADSLKTSSGKAPPPDFEWAYFFRENCDPEDFLMEHLKLLLGSLLQLHPHRWMLSGIRKSIAVMLYHIHVIPQRNAAYVYTLPAYDAWSKQSAARET